MYWTLSLRAVGHVPAFHRGEARLAGRHHQRGTLAASHGAQRVPTLAAKGHRHTVQPDHAVNALPACVSSELEARIWLDAVHVRDYGEFGCLSPVTAPRHDTPVEAVALEHAKLLQVRQVEAEAVIGGRPVAASPRSVTAHAHPRRLIEILCVNGIFNLFCR